MTVVTRFAPSPTGYLHVGGARTALYCWLYAKKTKGRFVLRIEDTDMERSTEASIQAIIDSMEWLGLAWDEGPFYQSKRMARYAEVIDQLITTGHAYRCYCSKERLEEMRAVQTEAKQKPRYDGHCRDLKDAQAGPFVVRFRNPTDGGVQFSDLVHGELVFQNAELDDLIIARTDGVPTYNLTVLVDDWDMQVTHVIRGDDHINNTPRQINILKALGVTPPQYAHVPMILGPDSKRLSKRSGAVSVMQYREDGILPEALLNYLVRLGWSHGDQEIFSPEEMIQYFEIKDINRAPAALNPEKLLWLNQHYIRTLDPARVTAELAWHMTREGIDPSMGPSLTELLKAQGERCRSLKEMAEKSRYLYCDSITIGEAEGRKHLTPEALGYLQVLRERFVALPDWHVEAVHAALEAVSEQLGVKLGKVAQPLRVAVTGGTISPPIDVTLALLGRERTISRLDVCLSSN